MSEHEFQLVVRKGPKVGQVFPLESSPLIIGRDPMSDILLNDPEVSRQHVRLTRTTEGYLLEDLGSTNGTYVDGQRLSSEAHDLQPGQSISIGSGVRLIYERVGTTGADEATMVDTASPVATAVETDPPHEEEPVEDAFAEPEPQPYQYSYQPETDAPLVPSAEGGSKSRRNTIIALVIILMLCCCCTFIGFMYQWGGDMLLEYLGWQ